MALKVGQGIAAGGGDPVIEIERILKSKGKVDEIHAGWDEWIKDNFPTTQPPLTPEPDTIRFEEARSKPSKTDTQPSMPAFREEDLIADSEDDDPYEGI